MGLRKRFRDFKYWCPQPPSRLPVKLRSYSMPIAAALAAALMLGIFFSLSSLQNVPIKPAPQLPQIPSENSTQESPTATPIPAATATVAPTPIPTPTPMPSPPNITEVKAVKDIFELTMSLEKTVFNVGEPVGITLTLKNTSNQTVNLWVHAPPLDLVVSNDTDKLIYQHTHNGIMPMIITNITLQHEQNITDGYVWPQRYSGPNLGPAVSPGTYYIAGKSSLTVIVGNADESYTLQTEPLEIMIFSL